MPKFIIAVIFAAVAVVLVSLLWPRVMSGPRPEALTQVRDAVVRTSGGMKLASVLGVSDERSVTPLTPASVVNGITTTVTSAIQQRAQSVVTTHASRQLLGQFHNLNEDQQQYLRSLICEPAVTEATPSTQSATVTSTASESAAQK